MNARLNILIAAAMLATGSAGVAQEWRGPPPSLPPMRDGVDRPMPMPMRGDRGPDRPMPPMVDPRFGYSPDERGGWMKECDVHVPNHEGDRREPGPEVCERHMERYQGAMPEPHMGPVHGPAMAYRYEPGYVTPGYVVPPLMWVRVPIIHERRACDCEEVIEERVATAPAPRARRVIHRRTSGKSIKLSK